MKSTMVDEQLVGRDAVWAAVRHINIFTPEDVIAATEVPPRSVRSYITALVAAGYVEEHDSFEDTGRFRVAKDPGELAPRIKRDGSPDGSVGSKFLNMWRTMRMLGEFSKLDLSLHSTTETVLVSERDAQKYISVLLKAGYLKVTRKAVPGKHQATYRFMKFTGPQPPQIQRVSQVYDPNTDQVTYREGARV